MGIVRPTVRSIAVALKLSRSTVSNALRGLPGVKAETSHRVQKAASEMGYSVHPFASEVMSRLRRKDRNKIIGTLGVLEINEPNQRTIAQNFNDRLFEGIKVRAAEIGFSVNRWRFGSHSLSLKRLNAILQARGIEGLIFLPSWFEPDYQELDWTKFTAVYLDYLINQPRINTVCSDHYRRIVDALENARARGYTRPGLAVEGRLNERLSGRFVGAYLGYLHDHPEMTRVPPLLVDEFGAEVFLPWYKANRPDVVITHWLEAPRCMTEAGAEIPHRNGYICLNVLGAPPHYSGFDQQPNLLGARAAEMVISQLAHHNRGAPIIPTNTLMPAQWVEGATIAPRL
jgi:LacI family transcriptional regulator